ncbi:hypothetical protein A3a_00020 [Klebsiella phage VLCpiA3a]|nr:hypothetical protein A3a_00020 [Klebsiella phage VLCpiA3a]
MRFKIINKLDNEGNMKYQVFDHWAAKRVGPEWHTYEMCTAYLAGLCTQLS